MSTPHASLLPITLCLLGVLSISSAQREGYESTPQQKNRLFFFSASAPTTNAINEIAPSVIQHVDLILKYVTFIEKRLLFALANSRDLPSDQRRRLCANRNRDFAGSIYRHFGLRGFPDPDGSCITDIRIDNDPLAENAPFSVDQLYEAVDSRGSILNRHMKQIVSRFKDVIDVENNFTEAELPHRYEFTTERAQCVLHAACGVRVREHWYAATPIHNRDKYENVLDLQRQVINEYSRPVDGVLGDNLLFRAPEYRNDGLPRVIREDTTTTIGSWRGAAHPNCFRRVELKNNPALADSLDKADHFIQQAEDALTLSGIAILVLPLFLNLIPVALLSNVTGTKMLIYVLLSDFLTCVPVLIKGIELIVISRSRYRAFTVRMTSNVDGLVAESAGAEVWAAECRAPDSSGTYGVIFVIVALVFIVIGVAGEVLARRYLSHRRFKALFQEKDIQGFSAMMEKDYVYDE